MPNGSLQSLLLGKNPTMLDWKARYHIAVGTARGLAYLHEECRDCIIHCDIKPENILLDSEYSPKLADFGLAKLLGRHHSRVLTTMRGTVGYLAPEWFSGEAITPKADVFSYGMLLIEVISGRRNREGLDDGVENFRPIQLANAVNKGEDVIILLDCRLEGKADRDELSRACKVACWCIQEDEKDRPTMREFQTSVFRQSRSSSSALSEVHQKALTTRRLRPVRVHGHAPMSKVHFKPKSATVQLKVMRMR
ncbi:hypothetical protein C1H46_027277 [Malus baccata]|uniref:Protein kinase domain-containing protein n=1 Tax=Malus baccata TaxID=106549 RepID=A0A540LKX8_MALBA|nr:hypothetical protein C1H46_027277 [Malus baccata]